MAAAVRQFPYPYSSSPLVLDHGDYKRKEWALQEKFRQTKGTN